MSDVETETTTTTDTVQIEHFGRNWTVPIKKQHSHIRRVKQIVRSEGGLDADDIAEVYLPADEYLALVELNVSSVELDEFATKIADAMGLGDKGNS